MSTPDSKKPLTGSTGSPGSESSQLGTSGKSSSPPPRYDLTPKSSIWGSQPMLIYTKGNYSLPRKLPIADSTETEIMMTPDDGSYSSGSSDPSDNSWTSLIGMRVMMGSFIAENKDVLSKVLIVVMLLLYCAYFVWAVVLDYQRAIPLIVLTAAVILVLLVKVISSKFAGQLNKGVSNIGYLLDQKWHILKWLVYPVLCACVGVVIGFRVWDRPENLVSLAGLVFFILLLWALSRSPSQVRWRPVFWGLGLQFCLAMIIQWKVGYQVFHFVGQQVQTFLGYTDHGAKFVFGEKFEEHAFAFKVLPVIIFFSCTISVLYHLGVMQRVVGSIAWVMRVTLGTTAAESLSAAGNIFVGQTDAPILIRPYLELMTRSELHAVMTGGFATIAGGVLAAYIMFGVPAEHLICASVMNAPCALAVSKLFYPETEESKLGTAHDLPKQKKTERNILEAAAAGASAAVMLVANVAANLIAFLALLAFVNAALAWLGSMVDHPELSFQLACSYLFMPVAYLMGVDWDDANKIGELLGVKIFLNEFVAYSSLGVYIDNRVACVGPTISVRSEVIATYALCGFANLSSIGIQLGGIGPMAPSRKSDLASIALRALAAGTITSLITASIAGLLIVQDPVYVCNVATNATEAVNVTSILNATDLVNSTVFGS